MFDWHEHEEKPIDHLDAVQRDDAHVQEDSKEDSEGDLPQEGSQGNGHTYHTETHDAG